MRAPNDCPVRHVLPIPTAHGCARCPLIRVRAERGQVLLRSLERPGALSFVAEGIVTRTHQLPDGPAVVFDVVPRGEAFSLRREQAGEGWQEECRAMEPVQLCVADPAMLADALARHPPSVMHTLAVYERIAERVAEWSILRAIPSARGRLSATLLRFGGERPAWASLAVLAEITGLRRETVCRALRPVSRARETGPSAQPRRPTA